VEQVRENTGWDLKVPAQINETAAPTDDELHLIREELDPEGTYTR
jgi:glutaconate CoA-transferase subunit B